MPQETGERGSGGGTSEFKIVTPGSLVYFRHENRGGITIISNSEAGTLNGVYKRDTTSM